MDNAYLIRQPLQSSSALPKRQRTETDAVAEGFTGQAANDTQTLTQTLGASYDHYLQNKLVQQQVPSYGSTQAGFIGANRSGNVGLPYQDPALLAGPAFRSVGPPELVVHSYSTTGFGIQTPMNSMVRPVITEREIPLPPDASNTLFVEGLPRDATEREVAHIFRPFLGYKEVRLVKKEAKFDGGSSFLLCFVDFTTPSHAMAAMGALEGYKMDLHEPNSSALRLQFAKFGSRRPQNFHGRRIWLGFSGKSR